jgi:hypothetical protein
MAHRRRQRVGRVAEKLPRWRFISPLRELAAHLRSLQKYYPQEAMDYVRPSLPDLSAENIARYIMAAHYEVLHWRERRPPQFFAFTQSELCINAARKLLGFLQIATDQGWERLVAEFFVNDAPRTDAADLRPLFATLLATEFAGSEIADMGLL